MTTCAQCAATLLPDEAFCPECGTPAAPRACPSCGRPASRGRFCAGCGAALDGSPPAPAGERPVAERRVTSVLFGDLVGFTPLAESRDAEEVRELLSAYFERCRTIVGRYGGVVEKFIGDAVMAVWGVPVAREDDAERAVRAGLELVAAVTALGEDLAVADLAMRVGVVTGEVAVTLGATAEGMVAGDAVNTAARVQSVAAPGRVWVDDATRALTVAAIAYADAGEHALKGKADAARLWQARAVVGEVGGGQRVDGLEAPLTGRDREMRLLKELFHATQDSGRARLVVLDGEAGVGKSRLVWEFEKYADGLTAPVMWHRGRCLSYGDGVAFWALAEAVRGRLGLTEADTGTVVTERLDAALDEFVPDADERVWLRPRLAALVGTGQGGGFPREELFAAWTAFVERVGAAASAVVLVVEDAQYADDGLLDFVDHLLATARAGVFVLAVARPELLARRPALGGRRATVIRLDPLDDEAMGSLVDGLVVGLDGPSRAALVARAEGVPLFAVETVRALIDRDAVIPRGGHYTPADGTAVDLASLGAPASLQALVAARLDALEPRERRVVADASVLGVSFTREGLAAVGSTEDAELDEALESLARKEIIALQSDRFAADRGQYRFVQSVVRQVAYGTQSRRDRKSRHIAAADHLAAQPQTGDELAVVIAQHLLDAVDASSTGDLDVTELETRACQLLDRAAVRARGLGSLAEARRLFEAALARTHAPAEQARLHREAADAAAGAGQWAGCEEHAAAAVALWDDLGDGANAARAAALQGRCLYLRNDSPAALALITPRWAALEESEQTRRALFELAGVLASAEHEENGVTDQAWAYQHRRLLLAEALGDPEALAQALIGQAVAYHGVGAPQTARGITQAVVQICRENGLLGLLSNALNNLSTVVMSRDLPAALALLEEGVEVARRSGMAGFVDYTAGNYTAALWTAARYAAMREVLGAAAEPATTPGLQWGFVAMAWRLGEATGTVVEVAPAADATGGGAWAEAASRDVAIQRLLAAGDTASAARLAQEALPFLLAAGGIDDDFMHFWPTLVRAALADGDLDGAARLLAPVREAPPGIVSTAVAAHLCHLSGLLGAAAGDDPVTVEADLRAGADGLTAFGAVGLAARAREDLGRWLAAQARPADAAVELAQVRATYGALGADGWAAQLDAWQAARQPSTA